MIWAFLHTCQGMTHWVLDSSAFVFVWTFFLAWLIFTLPSFFMKISFNPAASYWTLHGLWFLFKPWKVKVAQSRPTLCCPMDSPWNSLGHSTGVGSLSLLQGIFPIQGSNSGLPHCRQIHYQLSHKGNPRILGWVAYPFSSGSPQPTDQTRVSCTAGRFFTNCAITEALFKLWMTATTQWP